MSYRPRRYWVDRMMTQGPDYVGPYGDPARTAEQAKDFIAGLNQLLQPTDKLLDFGCGTGRFTMATGSFCREYQGVDLNRNAIDYCKREFPLHWANFTYLEDDKLPFPDDYFGTIMSVTVIQHITDDWKWWNKELKRVLRPLGRYVIIDHANPAGAPHMCVRSPETIASDLNATIELKRLVRGDTHWAWNGVHDAK